MTQSILWRRLDLPGHESARLFCDDLQWHLEGAAVFGYGRSACRLDYVVLCDAKWRTQSTRVTGWVRMESIDIEMTAIDERWRLDGVEQPALAGCQDIDLGFTPSTKLEKIASQVQDLSPEDLAAFRKWFAEFDAEQWDRQFAADIQAGRLDRLADKALPDHAAGRSTKLSTITLPLTFG